MHRHPSRAHGPSAGFSFIELLVTIVIAGIAFAAMVPLFLQAEQHTSADNSRNVALQIAQDKIEKVRQLDYDQITQANLESASYAAEPGGLPYFGSYWDFERNGTTKRYTIQYIVVPVPSTAAPGSEKYKKVEIRVTWVAPPAPVRAAVLQTLVYRQYAGPEIATYTVGPQSIFDPLKPDAATIIASPVVVDVTISPEDIASMNATAVDAADRGWVEFTVTSFTGVTVATQEVSTTYNGEPGHYQFVWDNSTAQDGIYKIEMTAVSAKRMQGSTATMAYNVELRIPPAPTGLTAFPGDTLVSLSWNQSEIGDFSHYELWRGTSSGAETLLVDDLLNPSYTDTAVNNGTAYYYKVRVVDVDDNNSPFSAEVSATPAVPVDQVAPSVPTGLTAIKLANAPTINLSWAPSTDGGTPPTGVLGYIIQRSLNGSTSWTQLQGAYPNVVYPDSGAGYSSTWYYRVAAIDNAANVSAFSGVVGPVTTDPQLEYSLSVSNGNGFGIYVWVQNVGTGQWYSTSGVAQSTKPAGVDIKKNKSQIWSNLPSGIYNVYASTSTGGTPLLTSKSGSGDLTAGNNTISF